MTRGWGEQTCINNGYCNHNHAPSACNKQCSYYKGKEEKPMNNKERIALRKTDGRIYYVLDETQDGLKLKSTGGGDFYEKKENYDIRYLYHPMYGKKVLVWDHEDSKKERILLHVNEDGSCLAINGKATSEFENGESCDVIYWDYWQPIPETKTITVTQEALDKLREAGIEFEEVE